MKLLKPLLYVLIWIVVFLYVQDVLVVDWKYPYWNNAHADRMAEFYELCKDGSADIQAVFLGSSISEYGISPMRIYQQSGITTYNLSFDAQNTEIAYYLLNEVFQEVRPQWIILEASGLVESNFNDGREKQTFFSEARYRYVMDGMRFGKNKIEFAKAYASHWPAEQQDSAFWSVIFPLFAYHDRWTELSDSDFSRKYGNNLYTKGEYIRSDCIAGTSLELVNDTADRNHQNEGWMTEIQDVGITYERIPESAYDPRPSERALGYFEKIIDLCSQNGAKLLLIKIPRTEGIGIEKNSVKGLGGSILFSDAIRVISGEYGVPFIDLQYDYDLGIDWSVDSIDGGLHLNYSGAKKVTDFITEYIQSECNLEGEENLFYDEDIYIFDKVTSLAELQLTQDLTSYLNRLLGLRDVSIFFSASDDMSSQLSEDIIDQLKALGFQTDFESLSYGDSFISVRDEKAVLYEASSNRYIAHSGELSSGIPYRLASCGWLLGAESEIEIDGSNYSMGNRGLNIVVYDNESGSVWDSVSFDLYASDNPMAVRDSWNTEIYLREYEQYLMNRD